ncbi:uncharacterized protein EV420DRAFT_458591 [Desarmillaria tabescens]|uniref:Uncharacterized protein n=1 Tax=Armillaria tabescens TaxID=1929756 RepID=A0AA39TRX4_ARMTA|nr:uncharacterized protein EV420DRAFT_458591 [Desarmillaria tabescens]KAK0468327.1 hypothetical protein EV420DRAFT_458591 [Desarmillaria tabescens]
MSHTSPTTFLVWPLCSFILFSFLLYHLWSFDRFKCLRWNNGPDSGAFKRVMTYTYLMSVPLILIFATGFTIIKYQEGYILDPTHGVIPKPFQLWSELGRNSIFPLMLMFSIGWSLEMVTHLEELCFWLFLLNAKSGQQDWFHSPYFKTWAIGSVIAVTYMPLVTILTRNDGLRSEAYTFLSGGIGSLSLTIWFSPILWSFKSFLSTLKQEGVDNSTVIRLTKFHELNMIRVLFRYMFTVPLVILGADGLTPHTEVNENAFATDLLALLAAFGCVVSSGLTLVIFFPRSIEGEIATREAAKKINRQQGDSNENIHQSRSSYAQSLTSQNHQLSGTYLLTTSPTKPNFTIPNRDSTLSVEDAQKSPHSLESASNAWDESPTSLPKLEPMRPNRRRGSEVELGGIDYGLTEANLSKHNITTSSLNPIVHTFTSPIDMVSSPPGLGDAPDPKLPIFKDGVPVDVQ